MVKIIVGIFLIILGGSVTVKSEAVYQAFGTIPFFDRYFGSDGGGRLGYKLIGMLIVFIGILVLTNMGGGFMTWLLSPLLRYSTPNPPEYYQ